MKGYEGMHRTAVEAQPRKNEEMHDSGGNPCLLRPKTVEGGSRSSGSALLLGTINASSMEGTVKYHSSSARTVVNCKA